MNQINGSNAQQMQINPVEVARFGLALMQRVQFTAMERQGFDALEALLNAIAQGRVMLTEAQQPTAPAQDAKVSAPN